MATATCYLIEKVSFLELWFMYWGITSSPFDTEDWLDRHVFLQPVMEVTNIVERFNVILIWTQTCFVSRQ